MTLTLSRAAFAIGGRIPQAHVQAGDNRSAALRWQGTPEAQKLCYSARESRRARGDSHALGSPMTFPQTATVSWKGLGADQVPQGTNDMALTGYDGPKPPKGPGPHRYRFRLAALDTDS